jgi:hypothetical protein
MWRFAALLALCGCDIVFHIDAISGSQPLIDAASPIGDVIVPTDGGGCTDGTLVGDYGVQGNGLLQVCVPSGAGAVILMSPIDTSACASFIALGNGRAACLIVGDTVSIVATTKVNGPNALVIAARASITITPTAVIDLTGSDKGPGPGGDEPNCDSGPGTDDTVKGGTGGAGASWQTSGGGGGMNATAAGGHQNAASTLTAIRGGCKGGHGGAGSGAAGPAGHGGGAIYLVAPTVAMMGKINASGGGGAPGKHHAMAAGGGGGGGSGGLIAIDAMHPTFTGQLWANGGGGGGGGAAGGTTPSDGDPGLASSDPTTRALGGSGGLGTQDGGAGGNGALLVENGETAGMVGGGAGAGGGGGGQGYIVFYTTETTMGSGTSSPTAHYE